MTAKSNCLGEKYITYSVRSMIAIGTAAYCNSVAPKVYLLTHDLLRLQAYESAADAATEFIDREDLDNDIGPTFSVGMRLIITSKLDEHNVNTVASGAAKLFGLLTEHLNRGRY